MHGAGPTTVWMHKDPNIKSLKSTDTNGNLVQSGYVPDALPRELDVTGNEAGFEDPYIIYTFDPDPGFIEPFVSFGNLANGQQRTYIVDGLQVPETQFARAFDFAFQGYFGMTERQARLSNQLFAVGVRTKDGPIIGGPGDEADFRQIARRTGNTLHRFFIQVDSWAVSRYISPFADLFDRTPGNLSYTQSLVLKGNTAGRALMTRVLLRNKGQCAAAIQKLLDAIGNIRSVRAANVEALFDELNSQKYLGIRFNSKDVGESEYLRLTGLDANIGAGGGLAYRLHPSGTYNINGERMSGISEAFVHVKGQSVSSGIYRGSKAADEANIQRQIDARAARTFEILIHEMFHVAAQNGMFGHKDLDAAADSVDKTLKSRDYVPRNDESPLFNAYVRKNCTQDLQPSE